MADNDLIALAERCEAATGSDRELDAAIAGLFTHDVESDDGDFWWGPFDAAPTRVPDFTASLDAALSLVPEGWHTHLALQDRHSLRWKWHLRGGFGVNAESRAQSAALALCAAALRARAAA